MRSLYCLPGWVEEGFLGFGGGGGRKGYCDKCDQERGWDGLQLKA